MKSNDGLTDRDSLEPGCEQTGSAARSPIVFVFLDPWTLNTNRLAGMLQAMSALGFTLLDFAFKTLSEADAEEIYRTNHPIREGNSWHVARLVYPMGRSLGLLLGFRDPNTCACAQMRRFKGKSNPSVNRPGQLRYDFFAPNRCLSLMHSSDDLPKARQEASVFFAEERLARACSGASDTSADCSRFTQVVSAAELELGLERLQEPGVGTLFARVRLRLVQRLQRPPSASGAFRTALAAYEALWEPLSSRSERRPVVVEAKQYLQTVAREPALLAALTAALERDSGCSYSEFYRPPLHEPAALLSCLRILSNPRLYSRWDSDQQLPAGVLCDRWERLLFMTHLFNFDDMLYGIE